MINPNDLVIVRRGDVEALKQESIFGVFRRDAVEFDKLNAMLANAPVVSGEPYGYIDTVGNLVKDTNINSMLARGEELIPYYLNPQQPQSVADALEEAAKIMRRNLTGKAWVVDLDRAESEIRALIKRNADGME